MCTTNDESLVVLGLAKVLEIQDVEAAASVLVEQLIVTVPMHHLHNNDVIVVIVVE